MSPDIETVVLPYGWEFDGIDRERYSDKPEETWYASAGLYDHNRPNKHGRDTQVLSASAYGPSVEEALNNLTKDIESQYARLEEVGFTRGR